MRLFLFLFLPWDFDKREWGEKIIENEKDENVPILNVLEESSKGIYEN